MLNIDVNDTLQISNPKINTNFENLDNTKQSKITSTGILKGNGSGSVTSATAGTIMQRRHKLLQSKTQFMQPGF